MAAPGEPQGCYSLRESRCFGNCLFLRHPWELGAVGKVHRATVGAEQTPELPPQSPQGATHLQREKWRPGCGVQPSTS